VSTTPAARPSRKGLWALVFAIASLCFFPLAVVAAVLGIMTLSGRAGAQGPNDRAMGIAALCLMPLTFFAGVGMAAAIAIPSFVKYTRSAKVSEARMQVRSLALGVVGAYQQERAGPEGPVVHVLPESLPLTPGAPTCGRHAWPADAPSGFGAIGFAPADPLYYSYELEVAPDRRSFVARAVGDLDCDGVTSSFELPGTVAGDEIVLGSLRVANEME